MKPSRDESRVALPAADWDLTGRVMPTPSPAQMPGARQPTCSYTEQNGLYRCVKKIDHRGNHTTMRVLGTADGVVLVEDAVTKLGGSPATVPPGTTAGASTPSRTEMQLLRARKNGKAHDTADVLDVSARLLRWTTHRGLTAEERSLLRTVSNSIVTRVAVATDPTTTPPTTPGGTQS